MQSSERIIYILHGDQRLGPLNEPALHEMLSGGQVGLADLAWSAGQPNWIPLGEMLGGTPPPFPSAAPPPPPEATTDVSAAASPQAPAASLVMALWNEVDSFYRKLYVPYSSGLLLMLPLTQRDCLREIDQLESRMRRCPATSEWESSRLAEIRKTLAGCRGMLATSKRYRMIVFIVGVPIAIALGAFVGTPVGGIVLTSLFIGERFIRWINKLVGKPLAESALLECRNCGAPPPPVAQMQRTTKQILWGGWTCPKCHRELDRTGNVAVQT